MMGSGEIAPTGRRIVYLQASWETQDALNRYARDAGFDLAWSFSGWPQASDCFDFHITVIASENAVDVPVGCRRIDPLELKSTGFVTLGKTGDTPALQIEANDRLTAIRGFFETGVGMKPTFADFLPHVSLSYHWAGKPDLQLCVLPTFPLVFDRLIVAEFDPAPATPAAVTADAAPRTPFHVTDAVTIGGTRRTADGYLVAEARCARTGIQDYAGFEVGRGDMKSVRVYRPETEVFSRGALASYAFRPVTVGHPPEGVTADNWKKEAVGTTGADIVRDGDFVRVPLVLMDADAIKAVEGGTREISMGYDCWIDWTAGTTADGQQYDAVQRGHRMNHLAIVERGRAGPQCKVGDGAAPIGASSEKENETMKLVVDGITYEMTDQAAELVKKLQGDNAALKAELVKAADGIASAIKTRDTLQGEVDALKAAAPTAAALDAMVADRAATINAAKALVPTVATTGRSLADIRSDVVKAKLGDAAVTSRSADYIAAAFDTLAAGRSGAADPVADVLRNGGGTVPAANGDARKRYLDSMAGAWQGAK